MFSHVFSLRVRYGETDQMGYVYYGNYSQYYEVGRVEAMRALGIPYSKLESEHGIWMPVISMQIRYLRPALYDDFLRMVTEIRKPPVDHIRFDTEIYNEQEKLINVAHVVLCFVDAKTGKKIPMPEFIREKLNVYFD